MGPARSAGLPSNPIPTGSTDSGPFGPGSNGGSAPGGDGGKSGAGGSTTKPNGTGQRPLTADEQFQQWWAGALISAVTFQPEAIITFLNELNRNVSTWDALGTWASRLTYEDVASVGHTTLDVIGVIPHPVAQVADIANVVWYTLEGDGANAVISLVGLYNDGAKAERLGADIVEFSAKVGTAKGLRGGRKGGHSASYELRDSSGRIRTRGNVTSGSDVPPGRRLSFSEQLAVHTETKTLRKIRGEVQAGDIVTIRGTKPPGAIPGIGPV